MRKLAADFIFGPSGWLQNHLLEVDEKGGILALRPVLAGESAERFEGVLCPGFVNAHCHLELSMLAGLIPRGTGMVDFVGSVVRRRQDFSEEQQLTAATEALHAMRQKGIVALGDISNSALTARLKRAHPEFLSYTFIELLGLRPEQATEIIARGQQLAEAFEGLPASISPHAPYSMSAALLRQLYQSEPERISVHLLESLAERALFDAGEGPFLDFFAALNLPFPAGVKTEGALGHVLRDHPGELPSLLVHATEMTAAELAKAFHQLQNAWLCLCPLSNLYIHDRLPQLEGFLPYADRICLGTDSLASNERLDIWAEVLCLKTHFPALDWQLLLRWATIQGAEALGFGAVLGSFAPGKRPGVLCLPVDPFGGAEAGELRIIA